MLIQIHVIRNFTTNNLNRGGNGAPKTSFIGGVLRAILSSQTIKRSIRMNPLWREGIAGLGGDLAVRTRLLPEDVAAYLAETYEADPETARMVAEKVTELFRKDRSGGDESGADDDTLLGEAGEAAVGRIITGQALFYGPAEAARVAEVLWAEFEAVGHSPKAWKKLKGADLQKAIKKSKDQKKGKPVALTPDVALFGRMITSEAIETVPSALQVAKALGVGRYNAETDFFTAVDDRLQQAALPAERMFTSNAFYMYYNVHLEQLVENLTGSGIDAAAVVSILLRAAVMATPSGNQNNSAAHNYPDVILVELSENNIPISYANAFVEPVSPKPGQDMVQRAAAVMAEHATEMERMYGLTYRRAWASTQKIAPVDGWQHYSTLAELTEWLSGQLVG